MSPSLRFGCDTFTPGLWCENLRILPTQIVYIHHPKREVPHHKTRRANSLHIILQSLLYTIQEVQAEFEGSVGVTHGTVLFGCTHALLY